MACTESSGDYPEFVNKAICIARRMIDRERLLFASNPYELKVISHAQNGEDWTVILDTSFQTDVRYEVSRIEKTRQTFVDVYRRVESGVFSDQEG